jgi:hypothetical protein
MFHIRVIASKLSYSITWQDKLNKPLSPTSNSADYLFTKLQYYMTVQDEKTTQSHIWLRWLHVH